MYLIIKDWVMINYSINYIAQSNAETIEIDFTDEEIELLNKQYDFIDWEFVKWEKAIAFEIEQKEARKKVILVELWILKNEKDWMELMWEDTTEIDLKIEELKKEFISLKE